MDSGWGKVYSKRDKMSSTTSNVLETSYIDNSERGAAAYFGQHPWYIKNMRKRDEDVYQEILRQGHGQFILGHIRYVEEVNNLLFYWGEIYNILEEAKFKPWKNFKKEEDFKLIYSNAFSMKEKVIPYRAFLNLKKMLSTMIDIANEYNLLEKYNLKEEYAKYADYFN